MVTLDVVIRHLKPVMYGLTSKFSDVKLTVSLSCHQLSSEHAQSRLLKIRAVIPSSNLVIKL